MTLAAPNGSIIPAQIDIIYICAESCTIWGRVLSSIHPSVRRFRWGSHVHLIGTQSLQTEMPMMFVYEITPTVGTGCTVMLHSPHKFCMLWRLLNNPLAPRSLSTGLRLTHPTITYALVMALCVSTESKNRDLKEHLPIAIQLLKIF